LRFYLFVALQRFVRLTAMGWPHGVRRSEIPWLKYHLGQCDRLVVFRPPILLFFSFTVSGEEEIYNSLFSYNAINGSAKKKYIGKKIKVSKRLFCFIGSLKVFRMVRANCASYRVCPGRVGSRLFLGSRTRVVCCHQSQVSSCNPST